MDLLRLTHIIAFCLVTIFLGIILYPLYIRLLQQRNVKKILREDDVTGKKSIIFNKLHKDKAGIPTMGGGIFLLIMAIMVAISRIIQQYTNINYSLLNKQETLVVLAGFFAMGAIGIVDDILNVTNWGKVKGLDATSKIISSFFVAGFIAYWFYWKLGIDYINIRPLGGEVSIGRGAILLYFLITLGITHAINFTDGLDGLAGGMMSMIFFSLSVITFLDHKFLTTTILGIMVAILLAFLWYNIHPAKVFMGDSGAFAMGGLLSVVLFILNMKIGILIPFIVLFGVFILEFTSSALQIAWKKFLHKKLFPIAPLHHLLEYKGRKETTIVMKAWMVQGILVAIFLIIMLYQEI